MVTNPSLLLYLLKIEIEKDQAGQHQKISHPGVKAPSCHVEKAFPYSQRESPSQNDGVPAYHHKNDNGSALQHKVYPLYAHISRQPSLSRG